MYEHIRSQMDIFVCSFEINANGVIHRQTVQAPRVVLEQQFMSLMEQAYHDPNPVMVKMSRPIDIWDPFDKKMIRRENSIVVKNSAYVDMESQ